MALKFKAKTKEEIPAELQSLYVERAGGFDLDVEGAIDKPKHDEFRALNVALRQQLEEHAKRFEGIDPEAVRKLAEEKRQLEEPQQLEDGEFERRGQTANAERDSLNTGEKIDC